MFKKRGGHNVKEPDFFVLFCFVLLVCFFVCLGEGGERMLLRGNGGSISRYQLSIKGELQRIDSQ